MSAGDPQDEPWTRTAPARAVRELVLRGVFGPLVAAYADVAVNGTAELERIDGPVVLVANHASHVDTPILLNALPAARRRRTLVGAAADYFYARRALAVTVALGFGTVPVQRSRPPEAEGSLTALAGFVAEGFSVLVFAEGTRSRTGRLGDFRPGAAALARRAQVPLVPVHIAGTAALMPPGRAWMVPARAAGGQASPDGRRRHAVTVDLGAALRPATRDDVAETMDEVRRFMAVH